MKPYETVQELLEDAKIHGLYVIKNGGHVYSLITSIHKVSQTCIGVVFEGVHVTELQVHAAPVEQALPHLNTGNCEDEKEEKQHYGYISQFSYRR